MSQDQNPNEFEEFDPIGEEDDVPSSDNLVPAMGQSELANINEQIAREERITTTLESKSFGRLAWERFRRNKQAVCGSLVIISLIAIGVFAPLLANRLPYVIEAQRPDLYRTSFFTLGDAVYVLEEIQSDEAKKNELGAATRANLEHHCQQAMMLLDGPKRDAFPEWSGRFLAAVDASPFNLATVRALSEELEANFSPDAVQYAYNVYYPVFRTLSWKEVAFIALFLFFLVGLPLRGVVGGVWRVLFAGFFVFWTVGGLWYYLVPPVIDQADYKAMARSNPGRRATFPPVHYGENENITEHAKEPPVWSISPEKSMKRLLTFVRTRAQSAEARREGMPLYPEGYQVTSQSFRARTTQEQFDTFIDGHQLAEWKSQRWTREEKTARYARLRGIVEGTGWTVPMEVELALTQGAWRLKSLRAGEEPALGDTSAPPIATDIHWLGTDSTGRDLLARMIYGTRIAMSIGVVAVSIYCCIGICLGAWAGYFGGTFDILLSRFIEVVICFPYLFGILILISFVGRSIFWIMIVIGLLSWPGIARLVRGEFLRLVNEDFVQAMRAVGGSNVRIILKHVLPNAVQPVLVSASFGIASAILAESGLSFLGLGVPPPYASWGSLLNSAREDLVGTWWMTVFPGFAIFITVTCFNLMGEGVRDALDPKAVEKLA